MNLHRRLEALEKAFVGDEPILLRMPGGRIETLHVHPEYLLNLLRRGCAGERTQEMELIAQSIRSAEPGGAHMVDVIRVFLNGPADSDGPAGESR